METSRFTKTKSGWRLDAAGLDGWKYVGTYGSKQEAKKALKAFWETEWNA